MQSLKKLMFVVCLFISLTAAADNKIKYYFNHPVDNSVSTGVNALNINGYIDDTLIAYINRSKYTLDIAVYDFTSYSGAALDNVISAINSAYTRGVKVRWIYNGSSSNTGLSTVNSGINRLGSPTTSSYGIMHCKFMVVDANSSDPSDAVVWTGSTNWSVAQFETDYDNVVIFQDSALAHAYRAEFNQMWGDTGIAPNTATSKFGPNKVDLGRHNFTIDGKQVELYFSPSDGTNTHIQSSIATANKDLYFGVYTFTDVNDANAIVTAKSNGVYTAGIMDQYSATYTPYSIMTSNLGSNFKEYTGTGLYHNKYLIVDPSDVCSDPLVLTGSHNWTTSANTKNDENTVIIHDATAANVYYQSFRGDFQALGGTLSTITGCATAVPEVISVTDFSLFPNPSQGVINVGLKLTMPQMVSISLINIQGQEYKLMSNEWQSDMTFNRSFNIPAKGLYILKIITAEGNYNKQVVNE